MSNSLIKEKSPYLRQHAENPVDWLPWGQEAFYRAGHEDKPIFLSIGYSTCHWCHVMAHESFEDIRSRVKTLAKPEKFILERIMLELENPDEKYHLFTSK